jgi:hypothetical protein
MRTDSTLHDWSPMRIFALLFLLGVCVTNAYGQADSSGTPRANNGVDTVKADIRSTETADGTQTATAAGLTVDQVLDLIGLLLITVGSLGAALGAPSPQYGPDGSVSMSGEPDKEKRIAIYRWQKLFPWCLGMVALGAAIQGISILI